MLLPCTSPASNVVTLYDCGTTDVNCNEDNGTIRSVSELKAIKKSLSEKQIEWENLVDGGDKNYLLNLIYQDASSGVMRTALMNASPYLTDEVLIAAFSEKITPLSVGIIEQIAMNNSPLSENVLIALDGRYPQLPNGIKNNINSVQEGKSPLLQLNEVIKEVKWEEGIITNKIIRLYLNDTIIVNPLDSVLDILKQENTHFAKCERIAVHVKKRDYSEALSELQEHEIENGGSLDNFCNLMKMIAEIEQSTGSCHDISDKESEIRMIASESQKRGCNNAQALLDLVHDEKIPVTIEPLIEPLTVQNKKGADEKYLLSVDDENEMQQILSNEPNPFSESTNIILKLPEDFTQGKLVVYRINGVVVKEYLIDETNNSIIFSNKNINNGVYFYSLYSNLGELLETQRMIIVK